MRVCLKRLSLVGIVCAVSLGRTAHCADESVLKVGDSAPEINCLDDQGRLWSSRDYLGKKVLVVYFYPSDFAFCCTRQAVRYSDCQSGLASQGAEVVGISGDAVKAHRLFKSAHGLNFGLLADEDGAVARRFGVPLRVGGKAMAQDAAGKSLIDEAGRPVEVPRSFTAARWTFIIGKDGHIIHRNTAASPTKDSQEVLEFLRKLSAK